MRGLDDLTSNQGFNPLTDKPTELAHYTLVAAAITRLENAGGRWQEHWLKVGVNRKTRRAMLKQVRRRLNAREMRLLRGIMETSRHVKANNAVGATMAAERKAELQRAIETGEPVSPRYVNG